MTRFTFLLPAYKSEFFEQALDSIKKQTYADFKVFVSDDCSPEDLFSIYDKVCKDDNRFTYFRNERNIGGISLVKHWNMLIQRCDTEFFIMASDDDVYAPTFLEEIVNLINNYPYVNLYRGRAQRINANNIVVAQDGLTEEYQNHVDSLFDFFNLRKIHCLANFVFRTKAFIDEGLFDDFPLAWGSDDTAYMKASRSGLCQTASIVFSFRLSNSHISSSTSPVFLAKRVDARMQNVLFFEQFVNTVTCSNNELSKTRLKEFKRFYLDSWLKQIKDGMEFCNWKQFKVCHGFLNSRNKIKGKIESILLFYLWFRARNTRNNS